MIASSFPMACGKLQLLLKRNPPFSVSSSVRILPASGSDLPTILRPRSHQMRIVRAPAAAAKPALLQIGAVAPMLRELLERTYEIYVLGDQEDEAAFLAKKGPLIRGVVTCEDPNCDSPVVAKELMSKLPNLEIVSSFNHEDVSKAVDVHLCEKLGVKVFDTQDALIQFCASIAQRLLMAISREISCRGGYVRACRWPSKGNYGIPYRLCNKHVGVVGLQQTGAAIARRMESLGCTIGYWCKARNYQYPDYMYFEDVEDLARHSDILIVSCSCTEETTKIINRRVLDALGPHGFVVNVSRGPVIDEMELLSAFKEGRIAGLGLDEFENEGQVPDELIDFDTCVLQPHPRRGATETQQAMADLVVANLEAHFTGKPLPSPVSRETPSTASSTPNGAESSFIRDWRH